METHLQSIIVFSKFKSSNFEGFHGSYNFLLNCNMKMKGK